MHVVVSVSAAGELDLSNDLLTSTKPSFVNIRDSDNIHILSGCKQAEQRAGSASCSNKSNLNAFVWCSFGYLLKITRQ